MAEKTRWPLADAQTVGELLLDLLQPVSDRIIVAGSVRRRRETVGDVELLAIPKYEHSVRDLFGETHVHKDLLEKRVGELMVRGVRDHRRDALGRVTFGQRNKLLVYKPTGIGVDLFTTEL